MMKLVALLALACGAADGPALKGTVRVKDPPKARRFKAEACGTVPMPETQEDLIVDKDGGVRWALVVVKEGVRGPVPVPAEPAVLATRGHRYEPRMLVVRAGQPLRMVNEEDHVYQCHGLPMANREFNVSLPRKGTEFVRTFEKPEVFKVKDTCHPWMAAWVAVVEHPYAAVTDASGSFSIPGLPAGKYVVEVWHERYKPVTREIEIKANGDAVLDVELKDLRE